MDKVRGSPGNPITRDQLVDKYRLCASRVFKGEALERSIAALEGLEKMGKASECVDALVG